MEPTSTYRADIDGLRAIAVVAVFLFHLEVWPFSGGFVGVDVFFVISGYLITRIIVLEIEHSASFDFRRFYLRRVRRLGPALIVTLGASLLAATLLLIPQELESFAKSLMAAAVSVSNILFWSEAGYFNADAITKPLLHTWSLSVEEQFYMFWPAVLVLGAHLFNVRRLWTVVVAFFIASLLLNVVAVDFIQEDTGWFSRDAVFFLTPYRVFELAIGAAVVWTERWLRLPKWAATFGFLVGLALIIGSILITPDHVPFPYLYALPACIGVAFVIQFGANTSASRCISVLPMRSLGKISYSLYLLHWPAIVYYVQFTGRPLMPTEQVMIFLAATVGATAMYAFVEQPFRRPNSLVNNRSFVAGFGLCTAALIAPSFHATLTNGWPNRVPQEIREALASAADQREATVAYTRSLEGRDSAFGVDDRPNILLIGDSMSRDYFGALESQPDIHQRVDLRRLPINHRCQFLIADRVTLPGYEGDDRDSEACERSMETILSSELVSQADVVLLAMRWYDWAPEGAMEEALKALDAATQADIAIIGRRIEYLPSVPSLLSRHSVGRQLDQVLYEMGNPADVNSRIEGIADRLGLAYLSPSDLQCEKAEGICFAVNDEGLLLYWDWGHWTVEGGRFFGHRMLTVGEWQGYLLSRN